MLNATFRKKWVYGDPIKVTLKPRDWFRWLRFVNIVADDHLPGTEILTEWDSHGNLYGYSQAIVDENELPTSDSLSRVVGGVEEAMKQAEAEDWRIETHQDIFIMAMRVIKWLERAENGWGDKEAAIREVLAK